MRVGFFAPMPPAKTGVADYAAALFAALGRRGSIELGDLRGRPAPGEIAIYHIGNNHLHRGIYTRAIEHPGVVVLHDAVLQHFFLGSLDERTYIDEFVFNYGEWMRGMAGELWRNRARSAADPRYFAYPMLKRIAERSLAMIVHNPAAAGAVRRHMSAGIPGMGASSSVDGGSSGAGESVGVGDRQACPDFTHRVVEIPHLFQAPREAPDPSEVLRLRATLGIEPGMLLVSVFGHLRESKRLPSIVRAMHQAWNAGADARLLIAGAFASSDLERAAGEMLRDPRILRTGYLSEHDFWLHAAATDVCVNLRFPAAGETSGIAIRLMGIGKAVVFTDGEEIARIPENACLRVDAGEAEEEMLARIVEWLARDREAAVEIGKRAARHIAAEHGIEHVARKYWEVVGWVRSFGEKNSEARIQTPE